MRILIAEDSDELRSMMVEIISEIPNVSIDEAENGQIALEKIKKATKPYDLALVDLVLPKLNGIDLISSVRKLNKELSIFVLSSIDDEDIIKKVMELKINEYLMKPFSKKKLLDAINELFEDDESDNDSDDESDNDSDDESDNDSDDEPDNDSDDEPDNDSDEESTEKKNNMNPW
ncbi:MAG: response regulator [Candidatus Ranarchaeia archaeon]